MNTGHLTFVCFVFFVVPVFSVTKIDPAHPVAYGAGARDNLTDKGERR